MTAPFLACMTLVAQTYALPPRVLPAIQAVEGGNIGVIHHNTDGSDDLGPMQVNTLWLPTLARLTELPAEEVRERLLTRPCFNVAAAGLILRTYLNETRGNLLRAVGNYHSHTPVLNLRYQARVLRTAAALFQRPLRPLRPALPPLRPSPPRIPRLHLAPRLLPVSAGPVCHVAGSQPP